MVITIEPTLEAYELAYRPYEIVVMRDTLTDDTPCWIACNPEFGPWVCMGQGDSVEEARHDLALCRLDYIQFLLDEGQWVPGPIREYQVTNVEIVPEG